MNIQPENQRRQGRTLNKNNNPKRCDSPWNNHKKVYGTNFTKMTHCHCCNTKYMNMYVFNKNNLNNFKNDCDIKELKVKCIDIF